MPPGWVSHLELLWAAPKVKKFWQALARHHCLVIYDKHGCGLSDRARSDFSLGKEVNDLQVIVDHLQLEMVDLLGISYGGPICLSFASRYPDRVGHLVLYGTFAQGSKITGENIQASLVGLVRAHWGMGSKTLADVFMPGADQQELKWLTTFQRQAASPEMAARLLEAAYDLDIREWLPRVSAPCLVMHRRDDKAIPHALGRDIASMLPDARLITLEGSDHFPWEGDAESVLHNIADFLGDPFSEVDADSAKTGLAVSRRLSALLSADAVGYSRLMGEDESKTVRTITSLRALISGLVESWHGRVVDSPGDNLLAEFGSAVGAVDCALKIQQALELANRKFPENRRMNFRIGINLGDVIEQEGRLYGDGVNIAARVQTLAPVGGVAVTGSVQDLVKGKLAVNFVDRGQHQVKNIAEPIRIYQVDKVAKGKR